MGGQVSREAIEAQPVLGAKRPSSAVEEEDPLLEQQLMSGIYAWASTETAFSKLLVNAPGLLNALADVAGAKEVRGGAPSSASPELLHPVREVDELRTAQCTPEATPALLSRTRTQSVSEESISVSDLRGLWARKSCGSSSDRPWSRRASRASAADPTTSDGGGDGASPCVSSRRSLDFGNEAAAEQPPATAPAAAESPAGSSSEALPDVRGTPSTVDVLLRGEQAAAEKLKRRGQEVEASQMDWLTSQLKEMVGELDSFREADALAEGRAVETPPPRPPGALQQGLPPLPGLPPGHRWVMLRQKYRALKTMRRGDSGGVGGGGGVQSGGGGGDGGGDGSGLRKRSQRERLERQVATLAGRAVGPPDERDGGPATGAEADAATWWLDGATASSASLASAADAAPPASASSRKWSRRESWRERLRGIARSPLRRSVSTKADTLAA